MVYVLASTFSKGIPAWVFPLPAPEKMQSQVCTQTARGRRDFVFKPALLGVLPLGQGRLVFSQFLVKPLVPVRLLPFVE